MRTSDVTSIALLAALAAVGFIVWRGLNATPAHSLGRDVGGALVEGADGVIQGAVETVGGVMGIPLTDAAACRQAIADGDMWNASFMCPAKDFFAVNWSKATTTIKAATPGLPNLSDWISDGTQPPVNTGGVTGSW